eukprot:TRINITY_DN22580_c0_g1_i1.p1 TRINITY_DN22580_c0_g1~~TRINITY_DN22580_c0_g1_i1.p1  ORF type:complete len:164 (-),score=46.92 TRINITY_DN22580_c0_g1_i1:101-538(-)
MGAINSNNKINREMFATGIWKDKDNYATENIADPVWRQKMSKMWTDCVDMAESIPQAVIENNYLLRMMEPLARFMKFAKCKKNAEKQMCAAAQAEKLIRKFNGSHIDHSQFGVKDKYEQAILMAIKKMKSRTSEEQFIDEVFNVE